MRSGAGTSWVMADLFSLGVKKLKDDALGQGYVSAQVGRSGEDTFDQA